MTRAFQPLLSATIPSETDEVLNEALGKLTYPLIGSPKIDGVRVTNYNGQAVTRTLKPVPNRWIRKALSTPEFNGFDGELTVGRSHQQTEPGIFHRSQSLVMTQEPEDVPGEIRLPFTWTVFDDASHPEWAYFYRWHQLVINRVGDKILPEFITLIANRTLTNPAEVLAYEQRMVEQGYEGIMLRHNTGGYKYGRSTLKQQILMRIKRRLESEAIIKDYEPMYENQNELVRDERGYAKRSAHKANLVELPMLGALILQDSNGLFSGEFAAIGFDHGTREALWATREKLVGRKVSYTYQPYGSTDKPRQPIVKGFRDDI